MMVKMKTTKCPSCGGIVFKLSGKAAVLCHDDCINCRNRRADEERLELERQQFEEEQRHLEAEEMERHFARHPHG